MVQRYDFCDRYGTKLHESENDSGEFVKYEDYEALQKERDALKYLMQRAYDELEAGESMHWVHQAINHLDSWLDEAKQ